MTDEYEEGIHARSIGLELINNPYFGMSDRQYNDWINGWKLENWRIRNRAQREEINRQIQIDRIIRRDDESCGG